ncbi:MAG: aspartate kinase [Bacteroidota bacterium]
MTLKIFKFGGASVKDAASVHNVASVLKYFNEANLIVVVSAMGKTTTALEQLTDAFFLEKKEDAKKILNEIKKYHFSIIADLFPDKNNSIYYDIQNVFIELEQAINRIPSYPYNQEYDQIVSRGEIIATRIVSAYLNFVEIKNNWLDVRNLIKTDDTYREGKVNWEVTEKLIKEEFCSGKTGITVTQGFLGSTSENFTTTLGREGSDYTASIFAYCTNAESVTIWKDVPGVMNADPKWFDKTQLIEQMSYHDAIELSYYGATVIHPKAIKPLQNKKIPLYVKSFSHPEEKGTIINNSLSPLPIPCFIFKMNQVLISIYPKDFSFIMEENFIDIFHIFLKQKIKINMMQNSAINFSVCTNNDEHKIPELIKILQQKFRILYNANLELITIRYYNQATIDRVCSGKKILMEYRNKYTAQLVVKNN